MVDKSELRSQIVDSDSNDWEFIDAPETWVLDPDRELMIREVGDWHHTSVDWSVYPDQEHDQRGSIRVSYLGTPFDHLPAFSLDGHRLKIIQPQRDRSGSGPPQMFLNEYEAQLSRIMSMDDFDQKIQRVDVELR